MRQQSEQAAAQASAEAAYDLATQRYRAGLGGYLTVLNAESNVIAQRRLTTDLRARAIDSQMLLVRALGGGYVAPPEAQARERRRACAEARADRRPANPDTARRVSRRFSMSLAEEERATAHRRSPCRDRRNALGVVQHPPLRPQPPRRASRASRAPSARSRSAASRWRSCSPALRYGVYYWLYLSHYESTDNAYVQGNVVQVTPQVAGTVIAINADDTDFVKAGQSLVRLDPADAQVALEQAEAQLAQSGARVRTTVRQQRLAEGADRRRAKPTAARAERRAARQDDVARRAPLVRTGAVGQEEFNHVTAQLAAAKSGLAAAQSATEAAREQLASNQSLTENIPVEQHPNVLRAAARVREAYLALQPRRAGRAGRRLRRRGAASSSASASRPARRCSR